MCSPSPLQGGGDSPWDDHTDNLGHSVRFGRRPVLRLMLLPPPITYNPSSVFGRMIWTSRTFLAVAVAPLYELPLTYGMPNRFIGKTGGEIFHEMMLRHGVKHICAFAFRSLHVCAFPMHVLMRL